MPISFESPDQPEVIALIAELDAYQDTLYPPESRHALDMASLKLPNVLFAVARDEKGHAIGCGAVVLMGEFGELKRMYVSPRARGRGFAKQLLALLESEAVRSGCKMLKVSKPARTNLRPWPCTPQPVMSVVDRSAITQTTR